MNTSLPWHAELFDLILASHMSGDVPVLINGKVKYPREFKIVDAEWQSQVLRDFFTTLDAMHRETFHYPVGDRLPGGNQPRVRTRPSVPEYDSKSAAPIGLWRNCYDEQWLAKLPPHLITELRIKPTDYNFTIWQTPTATA